MRIQLKKLTMNELELMMNWRMRADINRYMETSPALTIEGQFKWFEKLKKDESQIRWVIWADSEPVGSVYFEAIDYTNSRCSGPGWFIAKKEKFTFRNVISLQHNCYDFAFFKMGLNRIYGEVLAENVGVIRLVKLCGQKIEGKRIEHVFKDGIFRDIILTGLTKSDWLEMRKNRGFDQIRIEY